jgi:hypothetical protein
MKKKSASTQASWTPHTGGSGDPDASLTPSMRKQSSWRFSALLSWRRNIGQLSRGPTPNWRESLRALDNVEQMWLTKKARR